MKQINMRTKCVPVCMYVCVCDHAYQALVIHPILCLTFLSELFRELLNSVIVDEETEDLKF